MFMYKARYSLLYRAIAYAIACLFIVNDLAFGLELKNPAATSTLAPASRFNPIVSARWDPANEKYIIIENDAEKKKLIETSSFKDDVSFLYLNLLIGQFLKQLEELAEEGVSDRGLNSHLAKFKDSIESHFSNAVSKFDRFRFKDLYWENTTLCLPYQRMDGGGMQILRYYLPDGEKLKFPDKISMPLGNGSYVILEDPMADGGDATKPAPDSQKYDLPKLIETASDIKRIIDSEQVKERYSEYKEKALYMLGNDAIVGRFLKDNGLTKEKVQAMLDSNSYTGLDQRTKESLRE